MDIIKKIWMWLIGQLQTASDSVEYVSWLTASIFAVLAVFTIFLAHQYQTNTSELVKIAWKIRQAIKDKEQANLRELIQDFRYFSASPNIITSSIKISKVAVYSLVIIWGVSGTSMVVNAIEKDEKPVPIISILLLMAITILFTWFSSKLITIINQITNDGNQELTFKKIEQLKDVTLLHKSNFLIKNVFEIDNVNWKFEVLSDEPFISCFIRREYGFYNYSIMITSVA